MRSTVWMTLASACLLTTIRIARWPLNQAAWFLFSWPSPTVAMSRSRIGTPLRTAMTTSANCAPVVSASFAAIVIIVRPSLRKPCGEVTFAAAIALRTWSADRPIEVSLRRSTSTRTAGVAPPVMLTSATPGTWRTRCASSESAMLYRSAVVRVLEVSASSRTGSLFGLALR